MDSGSGSGCGCCGCGGCGCLVLVIAIIVAVVMVFAIFVPMNHNYDHMIPDDYQEYYPDLDDGTRSPSHQDSIQLCYHLTESNQASQRIILTEL